MTKLKPVFASLLVSFLVGCNSDQPEAASKAPPVAVSSTPAGTAPAQVANPKRKFQLSNLAVQEVKAGGHTIHVWLMDTEPKRNEGMMFLKDPDVKDDQGMLFVFRDVQPPSNGFWMHDTILPLDIIYITSDGKVLNIQKGQAFDETSLPAKGEYQYTLELKQGQAEKLGIKPGTKIEIPSGISASE